MRVFAWPYNLLPRNASHEEIVRAWENGPQPDPEEEDGGNLYGVGVYTPEEFAQRINDNDCAFGHYYVRFVLYRPIVVVLTQHRPVFFRY